MLILAPEIKQCLKLFNLMKAKYPDKRIEVTYRKLKVKEELAVWEKAVNGCIDILIGTRAAVFSPLPNLGLIIIDREDSYGYKEEQAPYYRAPDVGGYARAIRRRAAGFIFSGAFIGSVLRLRENSRFFPSLIPRPPW